MICPFRSGITDIFCRNRMPLLHVQKVSSQSSRPAGVKRYRWCLLSCEDRYYSRSKRKQKHPQACRKHFVSASASGERIGKSSHNATCYFSDGVDKRGPVHTGEQKTLRKTAVFSGRGLYPDRNRRQAGQVNKTTNAMHTYIDTVFIPTFTRK